MKQTILKRSVSVLLVALLVTGTFPLGSSRFYRAEAGDFGMNNTYEDRTVSGKAWINETANEGEINVGWDFTCNRYTTRRHYRFYKDSTIIEKRDNDYSPQTDGTFYDKVDTNNYRYLWNKTFTDLAPGTYTFNTQVQSTNSGKTEWHPGDGSPGWFSGSITIVAPAYSSSTISPPTTMAHDDDRKVTVTVTFTKAMKHQRNISGYLGATPVTFVYKSGVNTATHTYEATVQDDVLYTTVKLNTFNDKLYATAGAPPAINETFNVTYDTRRPPTLTTSATVSNLRGDSATLKGNVSAENGAPVTSRGVCYGTSLNPTVAGSKSTHASGGTGEFNVDVSDLAPKTTYHYRAYAVNTKGTSYGEDRTFTTLGSDPTVTTSEDKSGLSNTGVTVNGAIAAPDGLLPILERGAVYVAAPTATPANPTTGNSKGTTGSGGSSAPLTAFSSVISGLTPGQTYHYRAFVRNILNTAYGVNLTFTTTIDAPVITATANSSSLVKVNWSAVTGATAYEVYIDGVSRGTQTGTSYNHIDPGVNTQHSYKVQALGAGLLSEVSDAANARSAFSDPVDRYALANAPTLTVSNQTPNQGNNNLTITPGDNPASTQYLIEVSTDGNNWQTLRDWSTTLTHTHTGLSAGTTYYYRVQARNGENVTTGVSPTVTSKINSTPVLTVTTATSYRSAITEYKSFTLSGTVSDQTSGIDGFNDSSQVTVSATIYGKARSTTITDVSSNPKPWSLTWDMVGDNIADDAYTGITVSGNDGLSRDNSRGNTTWGNTLYVDRVAPSAPAINPALTDEVSGWTRHSVPVTIVNGVDGGANAAGTWRSEYMLSGATTLGWTNFADGSNYNEIDITNTGTTTVTARTRDKAGNISSLTTQLVKIDKVLPTGSLAITARIGASGNTASQQVNLGILATDTGGRLGVTTPVSMQIRNDNNFSDSDGWLTYATSLERWLLLAGDSAQEESSMPVYIRFKDEVGNVSLPYSVDTVTLDMSSPIISLSAPSATFVRSGIVSYDLTLNDATSTLAGVNAADKAKIELTADGDMVAHLADLQAAMTVTFTGTTTRRINITVPSGLTVEGNVGVKILQGAATDPSGNVSGEVPANFSFTVDSKPPTHQDQLLPDSLLRKGGEKVELAKASVDCTGGYPGDSIRLAPAGYNGTDPANGVTITSTHGESAVINLPIQSGDYYLYIVDPAGNVSAASAHKVTVQNEGPTVTISEPSIKNVQRGSDIYYIATYAKAYEGADITIDLQQEDVGIVSTGYANAYVAVSAVHGEPMQRRIDLTNIMGDGTIGIQIAPGSALDIFGNKATGSAESPVVNVDNTAPTLSFVGMASNNSASTLLDKANYAKHGDAITLDFIANEALQEVGVSINGAPVAATAQNGEKTQWRAVYTVPNSVTSGGAVAFSIAPMDLAGNLALPVTQVAGGGKRTTIDITPPVITITGTLADPLVDGVYAGDVVFSADDPMEAAFVNNTTGVTTHPLSGGTVSGGGVFTASATNIVGLTSTRQFTIDQTYVDVESDAETVTIGYAAGDRADYVTRNLTLPLVGSAGSAVAWSSSDEAVISSGGAITRGADADTNVTLTATIRNASATNTKTKEFNLTVKKAPAGAEESYSDEASTAVIYYAAGDNAQSVTADFALGAVGSNSAPVTWSTSSSAITIGGLEGDRYPVVITRPAVGQPDLTVELTANVGYQLTTSSDRYTEDSDFEDILEITGGVCVFADGKVYYEKTGDVYTTVTPGAIAVIKQTTTTSPAAVSLYQKGDGNHQECDVPKNETAFDLGKPYFSRNDEEPDIYTEITTYGGISTPPGILYTGYVEAPIPADEAAFNAGGPYYTRSGAATSYDYQRVTAFADTQESTTVDSSFTLKDEAERPVLYTKTTDMLVTDEAATAQFTLTIKAQGAVVVQLTPQQKADADSAFASVSYADGDSAASVTQNLGLLFAPVNGSSISWSSSDESVISIAGSSGLVTRDAEEDKSVTLTATVNNGEGSAIRTFAVTVKKGEAVPGFAGDVAALAVGYRLNDRAESVTQSVILPTQGQSGQSIISWNSNNPAAIASDGKVTRTGRDAVVTLTATIEDTENTATKMFTLTVKSREVDLLEAIAEDTLSADYIFAYGDSAASVRQNLSLPTEGSNGSSLSWSSDKPEVVSSAGVVNRGASDITVVLTVTIGQDGIYTEKDLTITVTGQQ